jgi:hypothetical protein
MLPPAAPVGWPCQPRGERPPPAELDRACRRRAWTPGTRRTLRRGVRGFARRGPVTCRSPDFPEPSSPVDDARDDEVVPGRDGVVDGVVSNQQELVCRPSDDQVVAGAHGSATRRSGVVVADRKDATVCAEVDDIVAAAATGVQIAVTVADGGVETRSTLADVVAGARCISVQRERVAAQEVVAAAAGDDVVPATARRTANGEAVAT